MKRYIQILKQLRPFVQKFSGLLSACLSRFRSRLRGLRINRHAYLTNNRRLLKSKWLLICIAAIMMAGVIFPTLLIVGIGQQALAAVINVNEANAISSSFEQPSLPVFDATMDPAESLEAIKMTTEPLSSGYKLQADLFDPRIADVQERLMHLGYMPEDEPANYYSSTTEYALQLFQRNHGLGPDGQLDEQTLIYLNADHAKPYEARLGDEGADIQNIQERLAELNYLKAYQSGYFGAETQAAIKSFQLRNELGSDGVVDSDTFDALNSNDANPARTSSSSVSSSGSSSYAGGSLNSDNKSTESAGGSVAPAGDPDDASVEKLLSVAKALLSKKYVRGGKGPNSFDCSGFVYYCLKQTGVSIKYMTSSGWARCSFPKVSRMKDLKKGDILCFNKHVGIYMGNGKMIDASASNGKVVIRRDILDSSYWTKNFICARRVF